MGGSAAYLTRTWLNNQVSVSAAHQPAGTIVVAAESLAYGATLTPDSVVEIPWFSNTLPEGAFAAKDDLINGGRRIVLSPLKRGEAVLRSKVTGPGQRASLASVLDEGKRAVTVPVEYSGPDEGQVFARRDREVPDARPADAQGRPRGRCVDGALQGVRRAVHDDGRRCGGTTSDERRSGRTHQRTQSGDGRAREETSTCSHGLLPLFAAEAAGEGSVRPVDVQGLPGGSTHAGSQG